MSSELINEFQYCLGNKHNLTAWKPCKAIWAVAMRSVPCIHLFIGIDDF